MKMYYLISPIGFAPNARGVSRLTGTVLSSTFTTATAHLWACPQPFGRSRRF